MAIAIGANITQPLVEMAIGTIIGTTDLIAIGAICPTAHSPNYMNYDSFTQLFKCKI